MATNTTSYSFLKPTVGGDTNLWGGYLNSNFDDIDDLLDGTSAVSGIDIDGGSIDGTPIGAAAASTGVFTTLTSTSAVTGSLQASGASFNFLDNNGNENLALARVASAVNHLQASNAATGNAPGLAAVGDDTNIGLTLSAKGSGVVQVGAFDFRVDTNVLAVDAANNRVGVLTAAPAYAFDINSTGGARVPVGTTGQRPTGAAGVIRFNSTDGTFEGHNGSTWGEIGGAGGGLFKGENGEVGSSAGDIFRVNEKELNTNVTIDADENASCAGPLTIATGVTLTVTTNGNLVIL